MTSLPSPRPSSRRCDVVLDLTGAVPTVVVDLGDWLDIATCPAVEAVLAGALALGPPRLAVDLSGCAMADPHALGMLSRMHARAHAQGTEMWLVGANRRVRRLLAMMGLSQTLSLPSAGLRGAG